MPRAPWSSFHLRKLTLSFETNFETLKDFHAEEGRVAIATDKRLKKQEKVWVWLEAAAEVKQSAAGFFFLNFNSFPGVSLPVTGRNPSLLLFSIVRNAHHQLVCSALEVL